MVYQSIYYVPPFSMGYQPLLWSISPVTGYKPFLRGQALPLGYGVPASTLDTRPFYVMLHQPFLWGTIPLVAYQRLLWCTSSFCEVLLSSVR